MPARGIPSFNSPARPRHNYRKGPTMARYLTITCVAALALVLISAGCSDNEPDVSETGSAAIAEPPYGDDGEFRATSESDPSRLGTEERACPKCGGQGYTACIRCNGRGMETCGFCWGTGEVDVTCRTCNGDGRAQGQVCTTCNGTGTVTEQCDNCSGTGSIVCGRCNGQGVEQCSICGGTGVNPLH